ncbi:Permease, DMT superfamily [Alloalcanivorax dieselolei B5]|uniref:Permease, DMT superfamily n=1 Tax=Alcanivorax dieselolei (strain DSM 16502 / CGMCC 1.3690 / MCCC 1A00001 / B-5) TaxID=930169 RepID=K0CC97_ALCDB|nr:EamA family transporter [Alloalcanivorax dieselolei]AFT70188.1 Permease, DMT superfamily [Alloalcanivorax dieselolei B5]
MAERALNQLQAGGQVGVASPLAPAPAPRPLTGVLLMAAGVGILPLMDSLAKYLSDEYHVVQVTWARYLFHFLLLGALLLWRLPLSALIPRHAGLQVIRSAFLLSTTLCYFGAIAFLPLANALALAFLGPLVSTALAPLILGESAGPRRWIAVTVGFLGTLVVIRPGWGEFHWASLLGLGAGVSYGLYQLTTRRLSGSGRPSVTLFYTSVFGLAVLSLIVPMVWRWPDPATWGLMLLMGSVGALAHFLIIRAFEYASAPVLSPVSYMEMVSAVTLGWLIFGDFPDAWTWAGIGLIVVSGLLIVIWE